MLADEPALFTDYAVWLRKVLESRKVPTGHLAESFELLAAFFTGHLPATVAARLNQLLAAGEDALRRDDGCDPYRYARHPRLPETARYLEQVLRGDQRGAQETFNACMGNGASLSEASVRLLQPAMVEVGHLWQENRITVAQEHLATALSQNVLARAYMHASFAAPVERKLMLACVAGNHHGLGLRIVCDAFETIGWDVSYLGTDVPTAGLTRQIDAERPDMLCLSLSLPAHLPLARGILEELRAELGERCPPIMVGGQVTLGGERVWRAVKADGWASDALHAIAQFPQ
ncbi:cobalamin B12-binding domain-containing protein [Pseudoduganella namucuonensis]|uniref:Methanogenic corrinoid protein MtbC1 n=1 Tax=Pseudoduganella namucuonensis TaxID=1035707 RepID=A0A1I7KRS3_9BURK|nr:cobalamin-dependent protein [Pseudoduganella namucuonensis]SFV00153.1 Methanogenic corrinoid protein MtbC1 [Pseudoduganella namucuonensis]